MKNPRVIVLILLFAALFLGSMGTAAAAEIIAQERYIVPEGTVIEDDLYVSAAELLVEGTVAGDIIFLGSFADISGEVEGDLMALATGVDISGRVGDDVRLLTASAVVSGEIGDDFLTTGGGDASFQIPLNAGAQAVPQGIHLRGGRVGGDLVATGGLANLSGAVGGDLRGIINTLILRQAQIEGGADVQLFAVEVDEESRVRGADGFRYAAPEPLDVRSSLSESIVFDQLPQQGIDWFTRLRRALGALAGFALLGYILLRYRPQWLIAPAAALTTAPGRCFFTGFMVSLAFLFLPVLTLFVAVGIGLFWGFLSGILAAGLVVFALSLVWTFSPLITGIWLGQRFSRRPFSAMLIGAAIIVFLTLIPQIGTGFSVIAFMAALGSLLLSPRMTQLPPQV